VRKHLDEGILHRLVGIVRVPQVMERETHGATLLAGDEISEPMPRGLAVPGEHQRLHLCRKRRIRR
jgi:hypothetical protein